MPPKIERKSSRSSAARLSFAQIEPAVQDGLSSIPFIDVHTHLFPPAFGKVGLWGIDDLLTYHYLEAEFFRSSDMAPVEYWKLSKHKQADAIWKALFVENAPISEATRGIVAVLQAFGLDSNTRDLRQAREFFEAQKIEKHVPRVFAMAGITHVVMTNDPLDAAERAVWLNGGHGHPQFYAALRLDRILWGWKEHWRQLAADGYQVDGALSAKCISEIRRFLADWHKRMLPLYMAVSLEDTFRFPDDSPTSTILRDAVLPACRELRIPMSLMIGVRRQVNPAIRLAGDAAGKADLRALEHLCRSFPDNKFLASILSRENQHEFCVYARKFANLMPFGCWWFLNNGSVVEEITRERIEMLGAGFIPQHSDARVLEQVIYKWKNTRRILTPVLVNTYRLAVEDGRAITRDDVRHDVTRMFRGNLEKFTGLRPS